MLSSPCYSQRAVNTFSKYLLHSAFVLGYLTVGFPTRIYRSTEGFIYLVRVHRLTPSLRVLCVWLWLSFSTLVGLPHSDHALYVIVVRMLFHLAVNLCFGMMLRRICLSSSRSYDSS